MIIITADKLNRHWAPSVQPVRRDEADRLRDLRRIGERQLAEDRAEASLLMFRAKTPT